MLVTMKTMDEMAKRAPEPYMYLSEVKSELIFDVKGLLEVKHAVETVTTNSCYPPLKILPGDRLLGFLLIPIRREAAVNER